MHGPHFLAIAPLYTCNQYVWPWERIGEKVSTYSSSSRLWERGRVNLIFSPNKGWDVSYRLWDMSHLFVCFVTLVIQDGAMAKFWPLHHYNQRMGENRRKTLSTAHWREGVST